MVATPKSALRREFAVLAVVCFSALGLVDTAYLSYLHRVQAQALCSFTTGCDRVLQSDYSVVHSVPLAYVGLGYYSVLFAGGLLLALAKQNVRARKVSEKLLVALTGAGFLISLVLVYLQFFVIGAVCPYCMGSAAVSTILFILAIMIVVGPSPHADE